MPAPRVTVLRDRYVPSPDSANAIAADAASAATLDSALAKSWPTDAHFTAYEPTAAGELPVVRLAKGALAEGIAARMVALVGDVDAPEHVASDDWRADVEPRLEATGLAWYPTRGGYRVVGELETPVVIASQADAAAWSARYRAWCASLAEAHGVTLDVACADWTRLYRLPRVVRDGVPTDGVVHGRPPPVELPAAAPGDVREPRTTSTSTAPSAKRLDESRAIVSLLGDVHDWQGARWQICGALGGLLRKLGWRRDDCETLIRAWLPEGDPAIEVEPAVRWACGAWERDAADVSGFEALATVVGEPAARAVAGAANRREVPQAARETTADDAHGDVAGIWQYLSFTEPLPPIAYVCEGLALAPSKGKISLVAGNPGGGKGPIANHLALCVATGKPVFGRHATARGRVLLLDFEGARLTMQRLVRMALAIGADPAELDEWLLVHDASDVANALDETFLDDLAHEVASHDVSTVVLDSYTSAMLGTGIEANSPQYAELARQLGRLDVCVVAVAHSVKATAERDAPRLRDVAYSGALAAMAQTAIVVHYPDAADETTIRVACARAPERRFATHDARFVDRDDGALAVEAVDVAATPAATPAAPAAPAPRHDVGQRARYAGERMLRSLRSPGASVLKRSELTALGGEGKAAADKALAQLRDAGLVELRGTSYLLTDAGRDASAIAVQRALGVVVGAFQRP